MIETQENSYYPFGLSHSGTDFTLGANGNNFQYNGKEKINSFGLNYSDYGFRTYDLLINRFISVDPISEKFPELTTYQYANNNPINRIDPDGNMDIPCCSGWIDTASKWLSDTFSGSDAKRNTQSVTTSVSYTLLRSQEVRTEYVTTVSGLDKTDSPGRTQAKMEARAKTPAIMREAAEAMRPSAGESSRVGGTASKTNVGVNSTVGTLGKIGRMAGVASIGVSVYNVATSENKTQAAASEGGAILGAIAGGEVGAQTGAAIGVWFGGFGALPGAVIGGVVGSIGGGIIGANVGERTYNVITTKKEDKK